MRKLLEAYKEGVLDISKTKNNSGIGVGTATEQFKYLSKGLSKGKTVKRILMKSHTEFKFSAVE